MLSANFYTLWKFNLWKFEGSCVFPVNFFDCHLTVGSILKFHKNYFSQEKSLLNTRWVKCNEKFWKICRFWDLPNMVLPLKLFLCVRMLKDIIGVLFTIFESMFYFISKECSFLCVKFFLSAVKNTKFDID